MFLTLYICSRIFILKILFKLYGTGYRIVLVCVDMYCANKIFLEETKSKHLETVFLKQLLLLKQLFCYISIAFNVCELYLVLIVYTFH